MASSGGAGARRTQKLLAILGATERIMLDEGYAAVTFRSVAAAADVAPGLVQDYFPSVDELFTAVLRQSTDRLVAELGAATAQEIVGWPELEGRALLDRLLAWSTQPRFRLRHKWRKGDLVIWDNTGMLHRALHFNPTSVRLLHRTTLAGDEPVADG
jgi:AcrR family transcriptional regulator